MENLSYNHPSSFYIDKLKNNEYFSFSRWGDGEFFCAAGIEGANCDHHNYSPELKNGLIKSLKNNKNKKTIISQCLLKNMG